MKQNSIEAAWGKTGGNINFRGGNGKAMWKQHATK